MICWKNSKN